MKTTDLKNGRQFTAILNYRFGLEAMACATVCKIAQTFFPTRRILLKSKNAKGEDTLWAHMHCIYELMTLCTDRGEQVTFEAEPEMPANEFEQFKAIVFLLPGGYNCDSQIPPVLIKECQGNPHALLQGLRKTPFDLSHYLFTPGPSGQS